MSSQLSGKYEMNALFRFAWPTVVMTVFMSLYTMVDGAFVARLVGTDGLSAVNIVYPLVSVFFAIGIMFGTGGSAIVARQLGEGRPAEAKRNFSLIMATGIVLGLILGVAGLLYLEPMVRFLGANEDVFDYCRDYATVLLYFAPLAVVQSMLLSFFVVDGKPRFGLWVVVAGGVLNMVLDYVLIALCGMGMKGAALATGLGYSVPCLSGAWYFLRTGRDGLRLIPPKFDGKILLESCINGSSEMVTNLSLAVITYLFNLVMMRHLGVEGVAAITIVLYCEYLLSSMYYGFSSGVAPLFSYQYGREDWPRLRKIFRNSLIVIAVCSVGAFAAAQLFAGHVVAIFAPTGTDVHGYATHGFRVFTAGYIFMGVNIFASALFTALSNGKISALLSFMRTFVFIVLGILILPEFFQVDGVWLAVPVAEVLTILLSVGCLWRYGPQYRLR